MLLILTWLHLCQDVFIFPFLSTVCICPSAPLFPSLSASCFYPFHLLHLVLLLITFEFQLNPSAPFHLLSGGRPRPPCNMSVWRKFLTALKGRSPFRHPHSLEGDCHIEGYLFYCPHLYSVVKKFFNVFISSPYSDYYEQF